MDIRKFFETRVGFPRRNSKQPVRSTSGPEKRSTSIPLVPVPKRGLSSMIVHNNELSNNALPCVSTFITNSSSTDQNNGTIFNLSFEQLYTRQLMWIKHGTIYGYKLLGQLLQQRDMERYLIDILHNIHGPLFEYNQYSSNTNLSMSGCKGNIEYIDALKTESNNNLLNCKHKGIYYWDVEWMCQWLGTLTFLTEHSGVNSRKNQSEIDTSKYSELHGHGHGVGLGLGQQVNCEELDDLTLLQNLFRLHCIDGPCFMEISLADWKEHIVWSDKYKTDLGIGVDADSFMGLHYESRMCRCFYLLRIIRDGWMSKYGAPLAAWDDKCTPQTAVSAREQIYNICSIPLIPLNQSTNANANANHMHSNEKDQVDCIYGQLVVLGYKVSKPTSVPIYMYAYIYMYVCVYICVYVCVCVCNYIYTINQSIYLYIYIYICVCRLVIYQ